MKKQKTKGWNLEMMLFNPPTEFQKPVGILRQPIGCTSYVYRITYIKDGRMYIGFHKEGDDIYTTSSTCNEFKQILASGELDILKYEILEWGSVKECQQIEFEMLTSVNAAKNPIYFNKWNGKPGIRKLNIEFINSLVNEIDGIRTYRNDVVLYNFSTNDIIKISVNDLMDLAKVQIRELEIDDENLSKIVDKIRNRIGSRDMPVLLENITYKGVFYEKLLVSGNHTRTALYKTKDENKGHTGDTLIECLLIPQSIGQELQDSEVDMIGNNLNADFTPGKPFSSKDGVKECLFHHKNGHSWETAEMRQRLMLLGLTSGQVDTVFKNTQTAITKQDWKKLGRVVYDYTTTHKNVIENKAEEFRKNNDDTFVLHCSSGNPHLYRWIDDYFKEQMNRISNGNPIQTKFKVVVYHNNETSQKNWPELFEKLVRPQHLPTNFNGYVFSESDMKSLTGLVTYPEFSYYEMKMWGNAVQSKKIAA